MSAAAASEPLVVLSTAPDLASARVVARALVEQRLAACVQLGPGLASVYRWQGVIEEASEVALAIKTVRARLPELERELARLHPYAVPELVVLAPEHVGAAYRAWLAEETAPAESGPAETRPAETRPAETRPAQTGPSAP